MVTLYETIFIRRQVRKYRNTPIDKATLDNIFAFVSQTDRIAGQQVNFEIASSDAVSGGTAPHYLLAYCEDNPAAYSNVGFTLENADLYVQSIGYGSGWFMGVQPKEKRENLCIALALGSTDVSERKGTNEFKRLPVEKISPADNAIARAVRLAPSALNSQPWKLDFTDGKVIIKDFGRGLMRAMLRNKLNKIDLGIAARYAVLALEHEGKNVTDIIPKSVGKEFQIEISYQ